MTDTPINPEVVALIVDLTLEGPPSNWRHRDGRPLTDTERETVLDVTFAELRAVLDHTKRAMDYAQEQEKAAQRVLELTGPYFTHAGAGAAIADIRPLMTDQERAELDQLSEFLAPDGTIVWQTQA